MREQPSQDRDGRRPSTRALRQVLVGLLSSLWLLGVLSAALVAMRQPLYGNDYTHIWGLKGRALLRSGELASLVRVDPMGTFAHPEYPPLWPLVLSTVARLQGAWDDLLLSPIWPLLCLAASLLAFRAVKGPTAARLAAAAGVSLLPYWRVPRYPGYAEGLFVVFVLAALGEVDRVERPAARLRLAAFLCLACLTKNEGGIVAVATAVAFGAAALRAHDQKRRRAMLIASTISLAAPFLLVVAPWQLWLQRHLPAGSVTDFTGGSFSMERAIHVALLLADVLLRAGWAWMLGVALLLSVASATARKRSGTLAACGLYLAAFCGALVWSRHDVAWHLGTTWDRLLFVPGAVLVVVLAEASSEALGASAV